MASFAVPRGAILAVSDFERSLAFYRDLLGFEVEALYDEPPYATLVLAGARLSLAEQGHPAEDRPGRDDGGARATRRRANVVLVRRGDGRTRRRTGARRHGRSASSPSPYEPPWGGCRFFCVDPDGYLVEIEQPA